MVNALLTALAAGRELPQPPGAPGPFSLADREITAEQLRAAGYQDVQFSSIDEPVCFGRDVDDAYSFVSTFGLTRGLTADLDDATRTAALDRLRQTLEDYGTDQGVVLAGSAWLITAAVAGVRGFATARTMFALRPKSSRPVLVADDADRMSAVRP
jgi:hypothetical protein